MWIFISFTSCIHGQLYEVVGTLRGSVLNEASKIYAQQPKFQVEERNGVMSVVLVRWKFDISIHLSWALIFSCSAYSFIKVPISSQLTTVFFNIEGKYERKRRRRSGASISH